MNIYFKFLVTKYSYFILLIKLLLSCPWELIQLIPMSFWHTPMTMSFLLNCFLIYFQWGQNFPYFLRYTKVILYSCTFLAVNRPLAVKSSSGLSAFQHLEKIVSIKKNEKINLFTVWGERNSQFVSDLRIVCLNL
jgi:hypothetical protein